jgi:phosphoglycolate phosphatase-like HAD superfamily hydrolase
MKTYATHVFDVDGVLLDSNGVKSRAFYEAALPYGEEAANQLVAFHQSAGSIGRAARLEHFFRNILGRKPEAGELLHMHERITQTVLAGTACAAKLPGVEEYLESLGAAACVVVSGIDSRELRAILTHHGMTRCFSRVYGGPRTKALIFREEHIAQPAVYYGDEERDLLDARNAGLDFVWVRGCSEWPGVQSVQNFQELLRA